MKTVDEINNEITKQGDIVRTLKAQKAAKGEIDAAVKVLLTLKQEFKTLTGSDWKPGSTVPTPTSNSSNTNETAASGDDINSKIVEQGDKVQYSYRKYLSNFEDRSHMNFVLDYVELVR